MDRTFTMAGALSACSAVVLGAFGARALRSRLSPDMLAVFETGTRYQMYHALGLPLGGGCFLAGWLRLMMTAVRAR